MRETDKCLAKRLYAMLTPYVQVIGWLVVAVPVVLGGISLAQKAEAFDTRLTSLEASQRSYGEKQDVINTVINTKLDTVIYFMRRK